MSKYGYLAVFFCCCVQVVLLAPSVVGQAEPAADSSNIIDRFSIGKPGSPLLLVGSVEGRAYCTYLVSTSFTMSALDSSVVEDAPLSTVRVSGVSQAGNSNVPVHKMPAASVGTLDIQRAVDTCLAMDLSRIRRALGKGIYGVLGMDFMKQHVVQIDFDAQELRFLREATGDLGTEVDLNFKGGAPYFSMQIAGREVKDVQINTADLAGASGAVSFATGSNLVNLGHATQIDSMMINQPNGEGRQHDVLKCEYATIGTLRIERPLFYEADGEEISLHCLSRFLVTFDFPNQRMYLKKGKQFAQVDRLNPTGVRFELRKDKIIVGKVDADSPAGKSGLRREDVILKVNDKDSKEYTLLDLNDLIADSATSPVRVLCERSGEQVSLVLENVRN